MEDHDNHHQSEHEQEASHELVVYGANKFSWATVKQAQVRIPLTTLLGLGLISLLFLA